MAKKEITEIVTRMVPIDTLKPDPKNPRSISDKDYGTLVDSLLKSPRLLWLNPLVVDKKGIVKVGNQRLRAAIDLGWEEIPAKSAEDFTPKELKELMIKDNLHQGHWLYDELESWDTDALKEWGMEIWQADEDVNLDDFFEENNEDAKEPTNKIILEYTQEDFEKVNDALNSYEESKEQTIWKLLGL